MPSSTTPLHPLTSARISLGCMRRMLALGVAAILLTVPVQAPAKKPSADKAATAPVKKRGVTKVTHQRSPSEETRSERDRRMFRECKGMHNAGACRGYTR